MKKLFLFLFGIIVFGHSVAQTEKQNEQTKVVLINKIESGIKRLSEKKIITLYKSDVDSVESDVNKLNRIDLEKSLTYYPKTNQLYIKADEGDFKRKKMLANNYKEVGQGEYFTLLSIIEEDEKYRSFTPEELIELIDRAILLMTDPDNDLRYNEKLYFYRGKAYYRLGNYYYSILNIRKYPFYANDSLAMRLLALSFTNLKNYKEAKPYLLKSLQLCPNDEDLRFAKYQTDLTMENYEDALDDLQALRMLNPLNMKYLKLTGDIFFNQKDYKSAIKEYQKIYEYDPENSYSYLLIGNCFLAMNDKESAVTQFNKAKELGNIYATKILSGILAGDEYIKQDGVVLYENALNNPLLILNTGMKVRILEKVNKNVSAVQVFDIENYKTIAGYIRSDFLVISILAIGTAKLNEAIPYHIPAQSLLNKNEGKVFFKGKAADCLFYTTREGNKIPLAKEYCMDQQ